MIDTTGAFKGSFIFHLKIKSAVVGDNIIFLTNLGFNEESYTVRLCLA